MAVVLITGATGKNGGYLVDLLRDVADVSVRAAIRKPEQAAQFAAKGVPTVHLDLDDLTTYAPALKGVDRLFLVAGTSVDMLFQAKNIVDQAVKAGIQHIVHVGAFTQPGQPASSLVGHFIWHQLVETYIEASGIGWTHLNPNAFMQGTLSPTSSGEYRSFWGATHPVGMVDCLDIAKVAAAALQEPDKHNRQHYYLSTEATTGADFARLLTEEVGRPIRYVETPMEQIEQIVPQFVPDPAYAASAVHSIKAFSAGQLPDFATVTNTVEAVTGEKSQSLRDFVRRHLSIFQA